MTQALYDSHEMLERTQDMFDKSVQSLRRSDNSDMDVDIRKMDEAINRYEQQVRHKVLKHLAITGGANLIPGLILTSIVIDIERIGDYTKNITDLAVTHPHRLRCGQYEADLSKIERGVGEIFKKIQPTLTKSDADAARTLMSDHWWILKKCDHLLGAMIKAPDQALSASDAIATALYTRYLKRITAHLINIASSVFNPFERIGFRDEEDGEK